MPQSSPPTAHLPVALACFALLALALFAPALQGDRLFVPLHTAPLLPWRSDLPAEEVATLRAAGNPELSDKLWLIGPGAAAVEACVTRGEWPTWNPTIAGGVPLLGEALDGALYPPNLLLWRWLPIESAFAWNAALHVVIAALGAWWLARRLSATAGAALLAGILFAASGPLSVRYHYPMTFYAAVWVPWLLAAVHAFAKGPGVARWLAIPPPIALIVLSGFPQTGLYGIAGGAVWGALLLARSRRLAGWRPALALAGAFIVGALLAAPQILPVDATIPRSLQRPHRALQQIEEAATPAALIGYALPGSFVDSHESWSLDFGKNPLWNALYARTRPDADGGTEPIGHGVSPSTTETTCYAGALALGLALAAFCSRRRDAALTAALGLLVALLWCWSYALGAPWVVRAVAMLPRFDIGEVRRILPTCGLLAALLAAFGAQRFVAPEGRAARWCAGITTALVALALAGIAWQVQRMGVAGLAAWFHELQVARYGADRVAANAVMAARTAEQDLALHAFVTHHAWRGAAWFAAGAAVLALAGAFAARGRRGLAWGSLALFFVADLGTLHFRVNPFLPAGQFAAPPAALEPLASATSGGRVRRFAPDWRSGDDMIERLPLPPNLGGRFGLDDGEGYLVMLPTRYARWLRALEPESVKGETLAVVAAYPLHQLAALRSPLLVGSSVRHLLSRHDLGAALTADGGDGAGWRHVATHGDLRVFENDRAAPLAFVVPEARFLPAAPPDDAIGTAAEGFELPISADAQARAGWHSALLAKLASDPTALTDQVWIEGPAPIGSAPAVVASTHTLALDSGATLDVAVRRVAGVPSRVASIERTPTHWRIKLEPGAGGFLVVNDGFDPDWSATVDGATTPVLPANVAWKGLVLPPGAREVVLDHRPASLHRGLALAAIAAGAWLLLLLTAWVNALRAPPPRLATAASAL